MTPIVLPRLEYRMSPNVSARRGPVSLVVAHRWAARVLPDERRTYHGVIDHLCDPAADASAHIVYEGSELNEATQLVPWGMKSWACAHYNSASDNIEFPDDMWFGKDDHAFKVGARIVAFRCHVRKIPAVWVRGRDLLAGKPGVTRHYDLGAIGGGHADPTTNDALWRDFMRLVQLEVKRGGFREHWGRR
jgi:hypothetical protein